MGIKEWKEYCSFCSYHHSNFNNKSPNYDCRGSLLELETKCIFRKGDEGGDRGRKG